MKICNRQLPERADQEIALLVVNSLREHGYMLTERHVGMISLQAGRDHIAFGLNSSDIHRALWKPNYEIRSVVWINDPTTTNGHRLAVYTGRMPHAHNEELSANLDEPLFEILAHVWTPMMREIAWKLEEATGVEMALETAEAIIKAWLSGQCAELSYGPFTILAGELEGRLLTFVDGNYNEQRDLTSLVGQVIHDRFADAKAVS